MIKIAKLFVIAILLLNWFLISCECPLEEVNPTPICNVREVTITKFNPSGTLQNVQNPDGTSGLVFIPDSNYSIHTFQFPFDNNSTGNLPNDERFLSSNKVSIAKIPFSNGQPYFLVIFDNYPLNNDLNGDIMVYDVSDDFVTAELRVFGSILNLTEKFNSENSKEFCDFVNSLVKDVDKIKNYKKNLQPFGTGLTISKVITYNPSSISILDKNNNLVPAGTVIPPQADVDKILDMTSNKAINITVKVGDVFMYKAKNGKYFIFVVTDIRQGLLNPFKRRVTIMFSEVN